MSDFPRNGGAMGLAIRNFDWSSTTLGPIETWPTSLKTVVQMMLSQGHAICLFWGPDLNIIYNDAYSPILGQKEHRALGAPFREIWSDVWDDVKPFVDTALSGEGTYSEALRLIMDRNGFPEETFWNFSYSPLFDDHGEIAGIINVTVDTTWAVQTRRAEENQKRAQEVLRHELIHRVKNTMAVTSAVVTATLRNAENLDHAREMVASRIDALSKAHTMLTLPGEEARIGTVVETALAAHLDTEKRTDISGPEVTISSQQAVGLSLALYELATNALKYGALSVPTGRIGISWDIGPDQAFTFSWQESGGPEIGIPTRKGFGSRLTNRIVPAYFNGTGDTIYAPEGLRFSLTGALIHDGGHKAHDHGAG